MLFVIGYLYRATTIGLVDSIDHSDRLLTVVRIHDHSTICITSSTTDDLEEGGFRSQESDLFRIQYGDKTRFWEIESLSEEIYSNYYIYFSESIVSEYFEALDCFYF